MFPDLAGNGTCIFVKSDFFDFFASDVAPRLAGPYRVISHNGDLSTPDGQSDAPRIGMPKYQASHHLQREFEAGRLIAHHGQNLWWVNLTLSRGAGLLSFAKKSSLCSK
jgi:hypothetical protein